MCLETARLVANSVDPDSAASDLGLHYFLWLICRYT